MGGWERERLGGWEAPFTRQGRGKESGVAAMSADPQKVSSILCALTPSCHSPWQPAWRLNPVTGRQWVVLF